MVGLFTTTIYAHNPNDVDRAITGAKQYYIQAQNATNRVQRLDLSYQAIQMIMGNLPEDNMLAKLRLSLIHISEPTRP